MFEQIDNFFTFIAHSLQPQLKDENKHFIQLCCRNLYYVRKEQNLQFNFAQKFFMMTFLNEAPFLQLPFMSLPLYGGLKLTQVILRKHKTWTSYKFHKYFPHTLAIYAIFVYAVRFYAPDFFIENIYAQQISQLREQGALKNPLLYDKVIQMNKIIEHDRLFKQERIETEKQENVFNKVLDFAVEKSAILMHKPESKVNMQEYIVVRKIHQRNLDEQELSQLQKDIEEYLS